MEWNQNLKNGNSFISGTIFVNNYTYSTEEIKKAKIDTHRNIFLVLFRTMNRLPQRFPRDVLMSDLHHVFLLPMKS